ncbi:hypothetical protein J4Q44_G00115440 [Coregonus suidteri]|uniref:Uncharacterized protein n=1 Tax=Coregonus suidteri TaxID=861788 RepID=A0AAN8LT85_9TELE
MVSGCRSVRHNGEVCPVAEPERAEQWVRNAGGAAEAMEGRSVSLAGALGWLLWPQTPCSFIQWEVGARDLRDKDIFPKEEKSAGSLTRAREALKAKERDRQAGAGYSWSNKEVITALIVGLWCGHEKDRAREREESVVQCARS